MNRKTRFEKSLDCPTNESLLAFLRAAPQSSPEAETQEIIAHLATCEFCELTVELLRAHPESPVAEPSSIPHAPESLLRFFTSKRETNNSSDSSIF